MVKRITDSANYRLTIPALQGLGLLLRLPA